VVGTGWGDVAAALVERWNGTVPGTPAMQQQAAADMATLRFSPLDAVDVARDS